MAANRVFSGIPRLDDILHGGFLRGGTYVVMGTPGTGKTIFSNQTCFNHIREQSGRCVYMTLLIESHEKMIEHLSALDFFDRSRVPKDLEYVSGYGALRESGFAGLLSVIRKTLRETRATLFVIDGMESAAELAQKPQEIREFVHELQGHARMLGCTTLLISNLRKEHPENALVDGVIELSDHLIGPRAVRELTVHKFRGSGYLRGRHEVEISERGMVIHPRTEVQFSQPPERGEEERIRMGFGVPRLDEMLRGGLPSGSATAVIGSPGTGKTLLGLCFLVEGARQGQHGIYFGFNEPPPRLIEKAEGVGIPLRQCVERGRIELIWQPPLEHFMDSLAERLLEKVRAEKEPRRRIFIDGLEGFRAAAVYPDRMPRFLSAFTNQLRAEDVSTLISDELDLFGSEVALPTPELAHVVETVILLRYVELRSQLFRLLSIMKMRESLYDTSLREFRLSDDGVSVAESFESAEAILSGKARVVSPGHKGRRR